MEFYSGGDVPKVTAPKGSSEWITQVVAYERWLDECYASVGDTPEVSDEDEHEEYDYKL